MQAELDIFENDFFGGTFLFCYHSKITKWIWLFI